MEPLLVLDDVTCKLLNDDTGATFAGIPDLGALFIVLARVLLATGVDSLFG